MKTAEEFRKCDQEFVRKTASDNYGVVPFWAVAADNELGDVTSQMEVTLTVLKFYIMNKLIHILDE